jgi:cytoskeletal protein CcmA (bactofilin family)
MFGRDEEDQVQKTSGGTGSASILGAGSHFKGTIKASGTLRVEGEFEGDAECRETLEVGKTGTVKANLVVKEAVIAGRVSGNIKASNRIELQSGSHLEGDIVTKRLVIDEGVFFEGNCRMGEKQIGSRPQQTSESKPAAKSDQPAGGKPKEELQVK